MKSITLHNIDDDTVRLIEQKAKQSGQSLNKTIKSLLHHALGIDDRVINNKAAFNEFLGVWSDDDYKEFKKDTLDTRKVDIGDWS